MTEQAHTNPEDEEVEPEEEEIDEVVQQCVEDGNECYLVCTETVSYALQVGGAQAELPGVRMLLDCADACQLVITLLLRRSEFAPPACAFAADVCDRCAEHCEAFPDDQWMVECSETCRRCADSCREVASMHEQEGEQ